MFCVFSQWPDSLRPLDNGCCSRGMMALDRITDTLVPEKQNKQTNKQTYYWMEVLNLSWRSIVALVVWVTNQLRRVFYDFSQWLDSLRPLENGHFSLGNEF